MPTGISQTIQCSQLGAGGSGSITFDIPDSFLTTGTLQGAVISYTYNNCSYAGYTFNGAFRITYTRYASPTDFTYTASWNNFTFTGPGATSGTYSGTQTCTYSAAAVTCDYSDSTGRSWSNTVNWNASTSTLNGSYTANYGSGVVTVTYENFGAVGGRAVITGSNGSRMVIERLSATRYRVTITVDGQTTVYEYGS
jgi:hypothetical protein